MSAGGTQIRLPKVTVTKDVQATSISNAPQKYLLIGQMLTGTATAGELYEGVPRDDVSINALVGAKSMIGAMARASRAINKETVMDMIPLADNGSAVDATAVVAFSGTATEAGTITVNVASRVNHSYDVAVADTDTATAIGDALVALITADTNAPFTAVNSTGTVTITASNGGTVANGFLLEYSGTPVAGVTTTLTGWTGGATDPVLTTVLDAVGEERYQTIVFPSEYGTTFIDTWIADRWNVTNDVLDGVVILTATDTLANHKTRLASLNNQSIVEFCDKVEDETSYKGSAMGEIDYIKSCYVGAIRALRLTDGSNLADYVIQKDAPLDKIGGVHMASFPYFNTPIAQLPLIDIDKGWTSEEIGELNATTVGGSVIGNNKTRTSVLIGNVITTRKTDSAGNPETFYHYLNPVDVASSSAEYIFNNLKADYAQSRLTLGALPRGHAMANENSIRAKLLEYFFTLAGDDYLLFENSDTAKETFEDSMIVLISLIQGKVTASADANIISQLREIIAIISYGYSLQA